MCTVLGVARSTYYKSFDKTKSARELENEELKSAVNDNITMNRKWKIKMYKNDH